MTLKVFDGSTWVDVKSQIKVQEAGQPTLTDIKEVWHTAAGGATPNWQKVWAKETIVLLSGGGRNIDLRLEYDIRVLPPPVAGDVIIFRNPAGGLIGGSYQNNAPAPRVAITSRDYTAPTVINDGGTLIYQGTPNCVFTPTIVGDKLYIVPKTFSMVTGNWPAGVILIFENYGFIYGHGGPGGGYFVRIAPGQWYAIAGDGGDAIGATVPLIMRNFNTIAGGGGGGSGYHTAIGGGGGAGSDGGAAGWSPISPGGVVLTPNTAGNGSSQGLGGVATYGGDHYYGGLGGALGQDGGACSWIDNGGPLQSGFPGYGRAGRAVGKGANLITWQNYGTVLGALVN